MRTLWTVLSTMAIANLLALGGVVGWLKATDRLDASRLEKVRELFHETLTEEMARDDALKAKAESDQKAAAAEADRRTIPIAAEDLLRARLQGGEADRKRAEALNADIDNLRRLLKQEREALDADLARFTQEKAAWEAMRGEIVKREGDAQFKKALDTYEGLKPDKALAAFQQLIAQKQTDQVVSYLNAMEDRTRTRVIDAFIQQDPKLAADLLERLRTRGIMAAGSGKTP